MIASSLATRCKDAVKSAFATNGRLNDAFYRTFAKNQEAHARIVRQLGDVDSIEDIGPVREFRQAVESNESIFYTTNANASNASIYGIWDSMFGECFKSKNIYESPAVEHGLIFYDDIFTDVRFTSRPCVVTFGDFRKSVIRRIKDVPVFCVGPYIVYARPYYSEDKFRKLKSELGKTLLVFPAHSTDNSDISRSQELYLKQIKALSKDFNAVVVNAFWWNIDDPIIHSFESEGYKIVTAGFRDDRNFLSRLRTIMETSDLVVGDGIGTHVGYALSLGKPYRIIDARSSETVQGVIDDEKLNRQKKLQPLFLDSSTSVEEQKRGCDFYWGFSHLRRCEEIVEIANISRDLFRLSHGWNFRNGKVAHALMERYQRDGSSLRCRLLKQAIDGSNKCLV